MNQTNLVALVADEADFIVINKRSAISFHCEGEELGLFELVKQQLGYSQLFPVHRLDKLTTGLVILAKNAKTAADFGQLFESRRIDKYYIAVSNQKPKKKQGWIKGDMAKARRGAYKLLRSVENPAITQFISVAVNQGQRLFLIKPHSGKTHQIRVALKSIGSPILGDVLYQGEQSDRGYLHAYALAFELNGKRFQWCVAPSADKATIDQGQWFATDIVIQQLQHHWSQPWLLFNKFL